MDDLISRAAAIAVADTTDCLGLTVEDVKKVTDEVVKGLKQLPSAQPERKKGKWISPTPEMLRGRICGSCEVLCSACKTPAIDDYDFCPNCGADMRGTEA